jgi:hypothetical protein
MDDPINNANNSYYGRCVERDRNWPHPGQYFPEDASVQKYRDSMVGQHKGYGNYPRPHINFGNNVETLYEFRHYAITKDYRLIRTSEKDSVDIELLSGTRICEITKRWFELLGENRVVGFDSYRSNGGLQSPNPKDMVLKDYMNITWAMEFIKRKQYCPRIFIFNTEMTTSQRTAYNFYSFVEKMKELKSGMFYLLAIEPGGEANPSEPKVLWDQPDISIYRETYLSINCEDIL